MEEYKNSVEVLSHNPKPQYIQEAFPCRYKDYRLFLIQREFLFYITQHPQINFPLTQTKEPKVLNYQAAAPHVIQGEILQAQDITAIPKPNENCHAT